MPLSFILIFSITDMKTVVKDELSRIDAIISEKLEQLSANSENQFSDMFKSLVDKIDQGRLLVNDTLTNSCEESKAITKLILTQQEQLDTQVQTIHDICLSFKSFRLLEADEKRDQCREMSKQITSLSELAQHAQVHKYFAALLKLC